MQLSYPALRDAVSADAVMRRRQRLQPAFGRGDKIFPPTYAKKDKDAPPEQCFERRFVPDRGEELWCCLLDSIPSQANRFEECLLAAIRAGDIEIPYVEVDFSGTGVQPSSLSSLEVPHRIYDAYMRDSLLNGTRFLESDIGMRVAAATSTNATALLEIAPTTLVFGGWHTQGVRGGSGAKFQRCITSEIVGFNVPVDLIEDSRPGNAPSIRTTTRRTSSRHDPAGIQKKARVYKTPEGWDTRPAEGDKDAKALRPSEINHGSITPDFEPLGITMEYGEQTLGLSLAALRRLHFGNASRSLAARTYLAALALFAVVEQDARGYSFRSGCDLIPESPAPLELMHSNGEPEEFTLDRTSALSNYSTALRELKDVGFAMHLTPIRLLPRPQLVEIMLTSQDPGLMDEDDSEPDGDE